MVVAPSKAQETTHDAKEDGLKHDELLHPSIGPLLIVLTLWTKHHQIVHPDQKPASDLVGLLFSLKDVVLPMAVAL